MESRIKRGSNKLMKNEFFNSVPFISKVLKCSYSILIFVGNSAPWIIKIR